MNEVERCELYNKIRRLKKEKGVTILAHYYMAPELQVLEKDGGIADFIGDSLGLSLEAQRTHTDSILFCGVRFMAETALIINPDKKVFMPDRSAGCSLASSINASDIRKLKNTYPGLPVLGYINTYAETKTELDICCTSRNALSIIESLDAETILFVPDQYMGQNLSESLSKISNKKIILWNGTCEVHEQFMNNIPDKEDDMEVLMHWEVPQSTVKRQLAEKKGIVGSTGDILNYVKKSTATRFFLASECDLGVALKQQNAEKEFITPCIRCPHMKKNTLYNILESLELMGTEAEQEHQIMLEPSIIAKARIPVLKMLQYQ